MSNLPEKFWAESYNGYQVLVDYIDSRSRFQIRVLHEGTEIDAPRQYKNGFWTIPRLKQEVFNWFIELGVWDKDQVDQLSREFSLSLYHQLQEDVASDSNGGSESEVKELTEVDKAVALNLLRSPNYINILKQDMDREIAGENENKLLLYLIFHTTFLKDKIHPRATGDSSGGKSHLLNGVLSFLPPETMAFSATRLTGKSLEYHLGGKDLNNKIILLQEFEGGQDAVVSLRPLMSSDQDGGGLTLMTTKKDAAGNIVPSEIKCSGTPIIAAASTQFSLDGELETRTWKFEIDDSFEQTRRVMRFIAESKIDPDMHQAEMKELFHKCSTFLKEHGHKDVKNIWALAFQKSLPDSQTRIRRDMSKIFALIDASAYLHQCQRPRMVIDGKLYVVPTIDDYNIVTTLYKPSSAVVFHNLSKKVSDVYKKLQELAFGGRKISAIEIAKAMTQPQAEILKSLRHLVGIGLAYNEPDPSDRRRDVFYLSEEEADLKGMAAEEFLKMFSEEAFIKVLEEYLDRKDYICKGISKEDPNLWVDISKEELYTEMTTKKLEAFDMTNAPPRIEEEINKIKEMVEEEIPIMKFDEFNRDSFLEFASKYDLTKSNGFSREDIKDYFGEDNLSKAIEMIPGLMDEGYLMKPYEEERWYAL
jgi:predicted transcriptional regulator/GTPase SAR1 family protein